MCRLKGKLKRLTKQKRSVAKAECATGCRIYWKKMKRWITEQKKVNGTKAETGGEKKGNKTSIITVIIETFTKPKEYVSRAALIQKWLNKIDTENWRRKKTPWKERLYGNNWSHRHVHNIQYKLWSFCARQPLSLRGRVIFAYNVFLSLLLVRSPLLFLDANLQYSKTSDAEVKRSKCDTNNKSMFDGHWIAIGRL